MRASFAGPNIRSASLSRPNLRSMRVRAENPSTPPSSPETSSSDAAPRPYTALMGASFVAGAVGGTFLDGIHGTVGLLHYDVLAFDVEAINLHSSLTVPLLLGSFYALTSPVIAYLDLQALKKADVATALAYEKASPAFLFFGYLLLGQFLGLSAYLYSHGWPFNIMHGILAFLAFGARSVLDETTQGLLLTAAVSVAAPLAEVVLMSWFHLWTYAKPDLFLDFAGSNEGLVSWVVWCYFTFMLPQIGFARYAAKQLGVVRPTDLVVAEVPKQEGQESS